MEQLTVTPFGRQPILVCQIENQRASETRSRVQSISKWAVFNELCAARQHFGITDRQLSVLKAMLTFYPDDSLTAQGQTCVFPSNRTLSERAHGMPESTLRRHIAILVNTGLIQRHDSPNGKRYARRAENGTINRAFGFDLSPLLHRAEEIAYHAQIARKLDRERKEIRELCMLANRDTVKLLAFAMTHHPDAHNWDELDDQTRILQRALRRKLTTAELEDTLAAFRQILDRVSKAIHPDKMSDNNAQNERHQHNKKTKQTESEDARRAVPTTPLPLPLILKHCKEIRHYNPDPITTWHDLINAAELGKSMLGIDDTTWTNAIKSMGAVQASITVAAMLENADHIRNPGGYLRSLSRKAEKQGFSPAPMVFALIRNQQQQAA